MLVARKTGSLFDVISLNQLVAHVPPRLLRKGLTYFRDGKVTHLSVNGDRAVAYLRAEERFECALENVQGRLHGECSCQSSDNDAKCPHVAAVGFALLALKAKGSGESVGEVPPDARVSPVKIGNYLASLSAERLRDLLIEEALENPLLMAKLNHAGAKFSLKRRGRR